MDRFRFPTWVDVLPKRAALFGLLPLLVALGGGLAWYGSPKNTEVGYTPVQPVAFSHKLHAGDLGMDCRYCHSTVERSSFAAVPPTQTCMNCHAHVGVESEKLLPVRESWATGEPIEWVRVHELPDFVYFDHSAHLAAGVGCSSCHGRVDQMARVGVQTPLSMSWCLDCHRDPAPALRGEGVSVTQMDWVPKDAHHTPEALAEGAASGQRAPPLRAPDGRALNPPLHCSGCHR